jgi:hypothetical protein
MPKLKGLPYLEILFFISSVIVGIFLYFMVSGMGFLVDSASALAVLGATARISATMLSILTALLVYLLRSQRVRDEIPMSYLVSTMGYFFVAVVSSVITMVLVKEDSSLNLKTLLMPLISMCGALLLVFVFLFLFAKLNSPEKT